MKIQGISQLLALVALSPISGFGEDHEHLHDSATGSSLEKQDEIEGFISPELFVIAAGGLFEPGVNPSDLATAEHDPQSEATVQAIELHVDLVLSDALSGAIYAAGFQGEDSEWEASLEEAYFDYQLWDWFSIGGGQFLVPFGFQAEKHLHAWDFVNQNLVNSRALNEGELISQGGKAVFDFPQLKGALTLSRGGVRSHVHEHEEEGVEEHHLEADEAGFENWVVSADYKFELPFVEDTTFSASVATGENGFGRHSTVYGFGFEKTWFPHHANDEFHCSDSGVLKLRHEFIGREIGIFEDDHGPFSESDFGLSTIVQYGVSDNSTLSLRHDWVSEIESLELEDRHRISPALTTLLGKNDRLLTRFQYDYDRSESLGDAHTVWLQFQVRLGGESHHEHGH